MVPDAEKLEAYEISARERQKMNFNKHQGVTEHYLQGKRPDRETEAMVQEEVSPHSYNLKTPEETYRRNRRDLIKFPERATANQTMED